jgi:hypothetical protein
MALTPDTVIIFGLIGLALTTIGSLAASIAGIVTTVRTVKTIHILLNGRMDELIKETKSAATATGRAAGRAEKAREIADDLQRQPPLFKPPHPG